MKINKFLIFILLLVAIATGYYFFSTDRSSDTVLIGIVDANQVVVSSKIAGRIEKLYVDEGSKVKAGDLIAEIDSAELEAQKNGAAATINAYDIAGLCHALDRGADPGRDQQRRGQCAGTTGGGQGDAGAGAG